MYDEQNGFKKPSEVADDMSAGEGLGSSVAAGAKGMADKMAQQLKSAGIDADDTIELAEQRATDLQKMVSDEIRDRPFRALGWAVAAGFVLGIMSAR